ncbi:hypothetical protein AAFC00_006251 [Neodothiora populina]|uniref:NAD binding Rossmann fold oxidoreductase n=1 Tax=Neodothiora populina TaxID=2781224 RepID=A0ABR3P4J8_9PEZI
MSAAARKINAVVIGYGLSAKIFQIPLILALPETFNLYGVVQRNSTQAATDHPGTKVFKTVDEAVADSAVDLVVVSTPPATHFPFASAALNAGKHVLVEKPFVPTEAEARTLSALAKSKKLHLSVYQNRRWDLDFLTLKEVLAKGTLGEVAEFESHFDRFRPEPPQDASAAKAWKAVADSPASGALWDLGPHLIDQVYSLYGAPKSVYAVLQVQKRGLKTADCPHDACTVLLRYGEEGSETLVTIKASTISAGPTLRYWVRGTKGSFLKHYLDPQEDQLVEGQRPGDKGFAIEPENRFATLTLHEPATDTFKTETYPSLATPPTYVEYYRLLGEALQGKGPVPVDADQAADVLKIIEMAVESSKTGKTIAW